jgi:Cu2+-containing amine oxidase
MIVSTENFSQQVFSYINRQYGQNILSKVQSANNQHIVNKLLDVSVNQKDTVDHAANKVIAMLRINP